MSETRGRRHGDGLQGSRPPHEPRSRTQRVWLILGSSMIDGYRVVFLDSLSHAEQRSAWNQVRRLQHELSIPIYRRLGAKHKRGALRSNVWDDLCELFGRVFTAVGRAVVAFYNGNVVGFFKAPIRVPLLLCRMVIFRLRNDAVRTQIKHTLAMPGIEIWCANSMGVSSSHQGRGLPSRLAALALSQVDRPTVLVTGHEVQNLVSKYLHKSLGFEQPFRVKVVHLQWDVYVKLLGISTKPDDQGFTGS
jgi:hypothetical protein